MKVTVGTASFDATVEDSATGRAFVNALPMTLTMKDQGRNCKVYNLDIALPVNASQPDGIHAGDLLLYRNNGLMLYYQDASAYYAYTRLGNISDVTGLAEALGAGEATVTIAAR